jgi:hypothetical protein
MLNPYGVQRVYDLEMEEVARQHGRASGRDHEVAAERRRRAAAGATLAPPRAWAASLPLRARVARALLALAARLAPERPAGAPLDQAAQEQPTTA